MKRAKRLTIYKAMLAMMENFPEQPLCIEGNWDAGWYKSIAFCRILGLVDYHIHMDKLPELLSYKPKKHWKYNCQFWFDPHDRIRLKILERIIYKMEHPILGWFKDLFQKVH